MVRMRCLFAAALLCLCSFLTTHSFAGLRPPYEDALVVKRSELIVVGRLKRGSITYVPHRHEPNPYNPGKVGSWEHHATLVITEVLKGKSKENEIPIIIHFGLDPVIGGYLETDGIRISRRGYRNDHPRDIIEIIDTGSSHSPRQPLVKDAGEDNIWFLRRRSTVFQGIAVHRRLRAPDYFGIRDPEDLQPFDLKEYLLAYVSDNPAAKIRDLMKKNTQIAERAQRYLDHIAIQKILRIRDKRKRVEALLPYFLKRARWGLKGEAKQGIVDCGPVAGGYLREIFKSPKHETLRRTVIAMMGDCGDRKSVPLLIDLLERHHGFWAGQELENGWWNSRADPELRRTRRALYGQDHASVIALRKIGDATALSIIKRTKILWESLNFENPQIVEQCDSFLRKVGR